MLALLLILSSASAMIEVYDHSIHVFVNEDDSAYVEEVFRLRFDNAEEKQSLNEFFNEIPFSTSRLSEYGIYRVYTGEVTDEKGSKTVTDSDFGDISISYTISQLPEIVEETGKKQLMGVKGEKFSFWDGNMFILPYEPPTSLKIYIPAKYKIAEMSPEPYYETVVEKEAVKFHELEWNYKKTFSVNDFHLYYEKEYTISSMFSLEILIREIQVKYLVNPVYIIAGIIVLAMLVWYRKELGLIISESFAGEPDHEEENES